MTFASPIQGLLGKVDEDESIIIQMLGDSITFGVGDGAGKGGWVGRLGSLLGQHFDLTTKYKYVSSGGYATSGTNLHTGVGSNTITMMNGGIGGYTIAKATSSLVGLTPVANADLVVIGFGVNDTYQPPHLSPAQLVSAMQTFIGNVRTRIPDAPFIITTEVVHQDRGMYDDAFNALTNALVGQSMPVFPPLMATNIPNVWLLDTQAAFDHIWQAGLMTDTVHPNAAGYTVLANWIFDILINESVTPAAPTILTSSFGPLTRGVEFEQTLAATSLVPYAWSIPSGALPAGLTLDPESSKIFGIPTGFSFEFTLRATNIGYGDLYSEVEFAGEVSGRPLVLAGRVRPKQIWRGHAYPAVLREIRGGEAHPIVIRR